MINPDDLVAAWVSKLANIRDLVTALGGSADRILGYCDSFPFVGNLRQQIIQMPPGSLMVVWQGVDPVNTGKSGAWLFRHRFSLYLRAPESSPPVEDRTGGFSYGAFCALVVNGIPEGESVPLLYADIHPACDPIARNGPAAARNSLIISPDGTTLDYFEFQAALVERSAF